MKQIREENNNNGKKADKMHVKEWLHQNAKRPVKVKFGPDESFYLLNRKGDKLRTIPVKVSLYLEHACERVRHHIQSSVAKSFFGGQFSTTKCCLPQRLKSTSFEIFSSLSGST